MSDFTVIIEGEDVTIVTVGEAGPQGGPGPLIDGGEPDSTYLGDTVDGGDP